MHGSARYKRCCRRVCRLSTEIDSRTIDTGRRVGGRGGEGGRREAGGADEAAEWKRAAEEGGCEDGGSATSYGRH